MEKVEMATAVTRQAGEQNNYSDGVVNRGGWKGRPEKPICEYPLQRISQRGQ